MVCPILLGSKRLNAFLLWVNDTRNVHTPAGPLHTLREEACSPRVVCLLTFEWHALFALRILETSLLPGVCIGDLVTCSGFGFCCFGLSFFSPHSLNSVFQKANTLTYRKVWIIDIFFLFSDNFLLPVFSFSLTLV